ncbi:MAG TPA: SIS domain-containing protein [Actinomycetota bacterium]
MPQSQSPTQLEQQIRSQPDELDRIAASHEVRSQVRSVAEGLHRARRIWVVGTGTSQHAAVLGAQMIQETGRSALAISSMQFVGWAPNVGPQDAIIVISHTHETAYAMAARALAFNAGMHVVTITRTGAAFPDAIATVAKETSETYTVSYTASLLVLAMLAGSMGAESFSSETLALVPGFVRNAIEAPGIDDVPTPERLLVIAGVGQGAITAREGALKVREAARQLAEGYDAEYLLHGGAVPLDARDRLLTISPPDVDGFLEALGNAARTEGVGVSHLHEPAPLPPILAQIPLTARLQMLALRIAAERGQNPDTVITGAWADQGLWSIGAPER